MVPEKSALVVSFGNFDADPRHSYWTASLRSLGYQVFEVEIVDKGCPKRLRTVCSTEGSRWTVAVNPMAVSGCISAPPTDTATGRYVALLDSAIFEGLETLRPTLINVSLIVAIDLLIARNVLALEGVPPVIYDAHEVFVDSYDVLEVFPLSVLERKFWHESEKAVCTAALTVVTVSPGLAVLLESRTGVVPWVIPNFTRVGLRAGRTAIFPEVGTVRFVFVGRADPFRGLERLVRAWDVDKSIATLHLYIPDTPQKRRLQALSKSVQRTHNGPEFQEPVQPGKILEMLAKYHVGVIPYEYPYPYSEACPNKFGEYLAAGLAVIANGEGFVSRTVQETSLGAVFDWGTSGSFLKVVHDVCERIKTGKITNQGRRAFEREMNWEAASGPLFAYITSEPRVNVPRGMFPSPNEGQVRAKFGVFVKSLLVAPLIDLMRWNPQLRLVASRIYSCLKAWQ